MKQLNVINVSFEDDLKFNGSEIVEESIDKLKQKLDKLYKNFEQWQSNPSNIENKDDFEKGLTKLKTFYEYFSNYNRILSCLPDYASKINEEKQNYTKKIKAEEDEYNKIVQKQLVEFEKLNKWINSISNPNE